MATGQSLILAHGVSAEKPEIATGRVYHGRRVCGDDERHVQIRREQEVAEETEIFSFSCLDGLRYLCLLLLKHFVLLLRGVRPAGSVVS
jgi:hypothetical protein